ncbi:hypothetical protein TIFTF001_035267 [Ficus carica]|uniref:Pentatricopeptide repeat-containing protein n=1 Tax=Ficus carica TaxID=3494 RepID=A0AA88E1C8_FICCA|nr:hypothetical protein TIFTF001_035267 [Ficus carica]
MYAKCGCMESARRVFDEGDVGEDVFAWTAMIAGLASHGKCREAIELFDQMQRLGIKPDERTMTAVLLACRNAGWLSEGHAYLKSKQKNYGVWPTIQHYGCVVDLLARVGRLRDAEEFIMKNAHRTGCSSVNFDMGLQTGKWHDKARTRELMNKRGLVKPPGSSKIEIDGKIHEFIVGDSSHPEAEEIYSKLDE